ncbi:MAG: PKD domain-containing protein [Bacteroidota bacterium]
MLPVQVEFPKFVADQLLTSEDLNQLFGYLDEQNRLTRTNLLGIGIVCGLHLQINAAQTEVTITKGCGVTSEGYLITTTTKAYSQYKKYKVDTARVYDKFYKTDGGGNKVAMDVWELKQPAVDPDLQSIDAGFLKGKVILLFVELKEEDNKNCDPNSCDDKGINVTVSFLPMAVSTEDAALLMGTTAGSFGANTYTSLPELRMKRWDVPNSSPVYSQDIFEGYLKLLDKPFIDSVETSLTNLYSVFGSLVAGDYGSNPFAGLSATYEYLYNGNINLNQLVHLQYHYDLFSDLLLAYQEFRVSGTQVLSTCCPDSDLFPRHLLLGEAIPAVTSGLFPFRHYFIYSPLFDQQNLVGSLKTLFTRLVLLTKQFFVPPVQGNNTKDDTFLRITPSMLWNVPLSNKAIPYYYQVNSGSKPLYLHWDGKRTLLNDAKRNLSYHANQYNASDAFVTTPLLYDLEPYNFLRVEGIVGKSYVHVLKQVKQQITKFRLPVDIIALNTEQGLSSLRQMSNLNDFRGSETGMEMLCHFQDLESMYDSMRKEILCTLCKELKYYYDFTFALFSRFLEKFKIAGEVSQVELFDVCSRGYIIKNKSLGLMIEFLHRKGYTDETLTLENFFEAFGINVEDANNDDIPDNLAGQASTIYLALLSFFKIPLGIIRLSTLLTEDLSEFDAKAYCSATDKLGEYAKSLKTLFSVLTRGQKATTTTTFETNVAGTNASTGTNETTGTNSILSNSSTTNALSRLATGGNGIAMLLLILLMIEDLMDHLDVLIYNCKCGALLSLKRDYMQRYAMLTRLRQFGFFTKMHPGIQHKAGVPMGGTFIVVYHSRKRRKQGSTRFNFASGNNFTEGNENETRKVFGASKDDFIEKQTNIAGFIVDANGSPVDGAAVSIGETGESTLTSAKGVFKLVSSVMPYTLIVEAQGYEDFESFKTDDDTGMRIVLEEAKGDPLSELAPGTVIADFYLPYRCCSDCPPIQYIVNEVAEQPTPNKGPVANAGPDQSITLPANSVTLNGSASSDPDGTITSFQWTKLSGPGTPEIVTPASTQTDVKNLEEGVYVYELTVTDDKGSIARDTLQITVNAAPPPPNKPPVADAGQDQTIVMSPTNNAAILNGSLSKDEDGSLVAFNWKQVSGSPVNIVSPSLIQTVVTGFQQGVYEFELTVTDNDGATASDRVIITVTPPANLPPKADAGPDQVVTITANNNTIILNGSNSTDPEGGVLSFDWKNAGGPNTPNIQNPAAAITTVSGIVAGDYKFELNVKDDKGAAATAAVTVRVLKQEEPQHSCGPLPPIVSDFMKLEGSVSEQMFKAFREMFGLYNETKEYFGVLQSMENEPAEKHLDFFASMFANQDTPTLLVNWLSSLQRIIVERKDLRGLALRFYRVLVRLAMYIVCIQKEDIDNAAVKMTTVFTIIQRHVKQWTDLIGTGIFSAADVAIVKSIGGDIEKEILRVNDNGEAAIKQRYLKILDAILKMINSIP